MGRTFDTAADESADEFEPPTVRAPDRSTPARLKRTWGQRLTIAALGVGAFAAFVSAAAVWYAQQQLENRNLVSVDDGSAALADVSADAGFAADGALASSGGDVSTGDDAPEAADESADEVAPVETFPDADPEARNILLTGSDNNACIDPDSPYAAAFGDREGFGERSDTIMMWRVNPSTSQIAVLSFPRDLWVTIAGRSNKQRINTAYERDDPQRLIDTIALNFGVLTDHYVQVDFCAFKQLVDALDGVAVPFDTPVRDVNTGLNVPEPGCFEFDGDHALAYVRSRKLQFFEDGSWRSDGGSDLSRISRQQDFIRRVVEEAIDNRFSPSVISSLLEANDEFIVTDDSLDPRTILEFAGVVQEVSPSSITTYQVEAVNATIQGNAVLDPRLGSDDMEAILAVFRGEATLADRPEEQDLDDDTETTTTVPPTTVAVTSPPTTSDGAFIDPDTAIPSTVADDVPAVVTTTLPEVEAEQDVVGVVPDADASCR